MDNLKRHRFMLARIFLAVIFSVATSTILPTSSVTAEQQQGWVYQSEFSEDQNIFLSALVKHLAVKRSHSNINELARLLSVRKIDLNYDGVSEIVVTLRGIAFCSRDSVCVSSVYARYENGWHYVGWFESDSMKIGKDKAHGWRSISRSSRGTSWGKYQLEGYRKRCWVNKSPADFAPYYDDPHGWTRIPGHGGYFLSIRRDLKCQEKSLYERTFGK